MTDLIISRPGAWVDALRGYRVLVDGAERGEVRQKQTVTLPVEPGEHTLRLEVDFLGSETRRFRAAEAPVRFSCRPAWNPFLVIVGVVAGLLGKPWIRLQPEA